jgi:hypothetical protein
MGDEPRLRYGLESQIEILMMTGWRMEMENTVRPFALALRRIWNGQPRLKMHDVLLLTAPKFLAD